MLKIRRLLYFNKLSKGAWGRQVFVSALSYCVVSSVMIFMPKYAVMAALTENDNTKYVIGVMLLLFAYFIASIVMNYSEKRANITADKLYRAAYEVLVDQEVDLQYEEAISNENQIDKNASIYGIWGVSSISGLLNSVFGKMAATVAATVVVMVYDWRCLAFFCFFYILMIPLYIKSNEIEMNGAKRVMPENRAFNWYCGLITDSQVGADIRVFNAGNFVLGKCNKLLDEIYRINQYSFSQKGKIGGCIIVMGHFVIICVTIMLGIFKQHTMYLSDLVCVFSALSIIGLVGNDIISDLFKINKQITMLDPFFRIIDVDKNEECGSNLINGVKSVETIEFINVSFSYPGSDKFALKNVSLKIVKGQKVGIVGLNGAGKTTIIKLLCRLYKPDEGSILINGIDINKIELKEYRKLISVMFQDFKLLPTKIIENIECEQYDDIRNTDWLKNGIAYEWIDKLPYKEETYISPLLSEKCTDLSGGQKQMLAFIRAKRKSAQIMVLDEPTLSLDDSIEEEVMDSFNLDTITGIMVSHRLSQVKTLDCIFVLKDGKIVESGSHDELMSRDSLYKIMYMMQKEKYKY